MSIKLDSATAAKIEEFGKRRRKLILMRGICTFVTITLLSFGVVGLLDYLVFMDDWVRYVLSSAAYALLLVALYFTCIRQLTHKSTIQELALMFEMAAPDMKEKLISAVELSSHGNFEGYDSNIFKEAIQKDVSAQVGKIQLESILPKRMILKWTRAAGITFAVFAILLFIPKLKFGTLMLRAVVPTANVDRVSNIEITLIEPGNSDTVVPEGDAISVVIEISDPDINTAYMESVLENGEKDTIVMQKIAGNRFSTVVNVGRDDIRFRLRAHTALTRYYTLKAVPRPQVLEFEKKFDYPSYSGLESNTVTEKKGDIRILEGTEVTLNITADQPVKEAELRFENVGGKKWTVPLHVTDGTKLKGIFKVKSNATYKVQLVSEESGFINKFSPKYEVQSLADLLPSITLTLPKSDMSVPADEVIDIRGNADDDLGLKEIFLSYKHNAGNWNTLNIINTNLKTLPIAYKWELSKLKVEPGDEVTFRLGAKDRKGNEGFSSSIRLSIVANGFDQQRLNEFKEFVKVHKAISHLSSAIKENVENADKNIDGDTLKAKQKFVQLAAEMDNSATLAEDVLATIKKATSMAGSKVSESDLVLVGRVISYIKNDMLSRSSNELLAAVNSTDTETYKSARKLISKASTTTKKLNSLFKIIVAGNGADVITGDLYKILEEQKNLSEDSFQQNVSSEQVKRRQLSLFKNVTNTETLVSQVSGMADNNFKNQYKNIQNRLEWTQKQNSEILNRKPNKTNGSFTAEFFADDSLRDKKHSYPTHKINELWHHSPAPNVPNDFWSARWTGGFSSDKPGKHEFIIKHDGGIRLWVDEKLVINDWIPGKERESKYELNLEKDQTARIRLDYREDTGQAIVRLHCKYPDNGVHEVHPAQFDRYHFHDLKNNFDGTFREMVNISRMSAEKSQNAREEIRKLLKEEVEQIKKVAKDLEELAKAEEKLDKAIQQQKPEEEKKKLQKEVAEKSQKAEKSLENAIAQLEERAELEEMKKEADSQFVEDVAKTAQALENLKEDSPINGEKAAEKAEKLAQALDDLEKGHELKEAKKDIEEMLANERNEDDPRKKVTENPDLFKKAEEVIADLKDELNKEKDETSKQMADDLNKALHENETNQVRDEMRHREHTDSASKDLEKQLDKMLNKVADAAKKHEENMKKAREAVNEESPALGEQLEKLAQEARENQKETAQALEDIEDSKTADVQQQAKEMQKKQEILNDKLEDMRKALRRQANAQDISKKDELEKARDADDALAMLQQPPPKAEELLRKAANSEEKAEQQEALAETSEQQNRIADALEKLAKHYNKENEQELVESREELRKDAEQMAADSPVSEDYEKAEAIADNQQKSIDEQIADLEKVLAKDEVMQKELAQIAEDTAKDATQQLKEAARKEQQIDEKLDQQANNKGAQQHEMKQQAPQQQENQQKAQQAAEDLERSAKHQERLEKNAETDQANQVAEKAQQAAEKMAQAQDKLQDSNNFEEAQQAVENAKQAAEMAAQQAEAAQDQQAQQAAQQAPQQQEDSPAQQASKQMAQALDQLDQAKAAQEAAQQAMQQAQQAAQEAKQAAQNALQNAQAQQAAQQAQKAAEQAQQAAESAQEALPEANAEKLLQQAQQANAQAQQALQQAMQQAQNAQNSQDQGQKAAAQAQMAQAQAQQAAAQAQQANAQAQQAMQQAQQAMQQAQQSQSQAMAKSRQPSSTPGTESGGKEAPSQNQVTKINAEKLKQEEEWAKLPKRLARDLRDAKQENVPEQYRTMVNAYFKIIAEQSKNNEVKK